MKFKANLDKVILTTLTVTICITLCNAEETKTVAPWDVPEMLEASLAQRLALIEDVLNSQFGEDEGEVKLIERDHQVEFQVCGKDLENIKREECLYYLKQLIQRISVFKAYADMEYDFLFNFQSQDTMNIMVYVITSKEYRDKD